MSDLIPAIITNVGGPQSVTVDGDSVRQNPTGDLIKVDQYVKSAAANRGLPFRRVKLRPGGNADIDGRGNCGGVYPPIG